MNKILTAMHSMLARIIMLALIGLATLNRIGLPVSQASIEIDITAEQVTPLPVAVSPFHGSSKEMSELGDNIARVLRNNLQHSGIFNPLDPQTYLQSPGSVNNFPRFPDWRAIGARALVHGRVLTDDSEITSVEYRLWDLAAEEQLLGLRYRFRPELWRRVAHIIADRIFSALTGEDGFFDSRIVYVAESGPVTNRVKRLAIIDADSGNHRFLTQGKALVLTPRFSPADQVIAYMSYYGNLPRVYLFNLDTGEQKILGDFPGMTFAPRFSPDGQRVVLSMAREGNSDIFVLDIDSNKAKRLTNSPAIDTSPDYAPDGRYITFNSDRGGSQQLYVMNADGRNIKRISFGKGRYATPVWSPRGDLIAFTHMHRGNFSIGVMRPDGSRERVLTSGFIVESPSWSPNGRYLVFFRQTPADRAGRGSASRLHMIDVSGRYEREIATPIHASDPAWSPLRR